MHYAIISDIHANKEALEAVLAAIDRLQPSAIYCLGDLVGYNADPDACVDAVRARAAQIVRGNHDKAVAGILRLDWFNPAARAAAEWTRQKVRPDVLEALRGLPPGPLAGPEGILLCHGTPYDEDAYLLDGGAIEESFRCLEERYASARFCFVGHSHYPQVVARRREGGRPRLVTRREKIDLDPQSVYLINPGAVGQPRDGIALASFGILDTSGMTYTNIRVRYAVQETQRKIIQAGLPPALAQRLSEGR